MRMTASWVPAMVLLAVLGVSVEVSAQPAQKDAGVAPKKLAGKTEASAQAAPSGTQAESEGTGGAASDAATATASDAASVESSSDGAAAGDVEASGETSRQVSATAEVNEPPATLEAQKAPRKGDAKPPWAKKPDIDIGGYVHVLYQVQDGSSEPAQGFSVRSARLGVDWSHGKLLDGELDVEFTEALTGATALEPLRDAYVRISPLRELRVRLGQFKKPFSAVELWGRGSLPLVERGIGNEWITRQLGYGSRDIGLQLEGKLIKAPDLGYALGVFNGSGANEAEDGESKDITGRLSLSPVKSLEFGASGSFRQFSQEVHPELPSQAMMGEFDVELKGKQLTVLAEGMLGQNYRSIDEANSWSALLLAAYRIPISPTWKLKLEPIVKGEILKVEDHVRDSHILSGTAGANLHVGKLFRLMLQGELIRTAENTLDLWSDSSRLFLLAALNIR